MKFSKKNCIIFAMKLWICFLWLFFSGSCLLADAEKLLFSHYTNSHNTQTPYKTLLELDVAVTLDQAYSIQRKLVQNKLLKLPKRGFKLALVSPEQQKQYNISEPILGVIVTDQIFNNFAVIPKKNFTNLYFESEFGFILKKPITKPIESLYVLKHYIKSVHPVIEIVDYKFLNKKNVQIGDLIMANALSSSYVLGSELSLDVIDTLSVKAMHYDKTVSNYKPQPVSDVYLTSLMWAINKALSQGWKVSKGDLIITGSGDMFAGKKGRYIVDYGSLTSVMFDVR